MTQHHNHERVKCTSEKERTGHHCYCCRWCDCRSLLPTWEEGRGEKSQPFDINSQKWREEEREEGPAKSNTLDTVSFFSLFPSLRSVCERKKESALVVASHASQPGPVKRKRHRAGSIKEKRKRPREGKRERNRVKLTKSPGFKCISEMSHVYSLGIFSILCLLQNFLSQNHWNGCDPISFQSKKKKSHSHASASISHSSSSSSLTSKLSKCGAFLTSASCVKKNSRHIDATLDLDPITAELEKRRRRRCLILSTLFTLAIILGIFLVTSFVMFVISSYRKCQFTLCFLSFLHLLDTSLTKCSSFSASPFFSLTESYYSTSSPGSVVVTQPQSDTASLSVTGISVNAAILPTSSLPFFNDSNNPLRKSPPHWIESTAAANYDNSLASITPPATSVLVTHHTSPYSPPRSTNSTRQQQQQQQQHQQTVAPSSSAAAAAGGRSGDEEDEEPACLEGEEWKCADGLCIPREKRCDGHFNCYDHSDEANCNPCPLSEGYFHCGNETSCLDPSKRCNGIFDCWDGSDEHLCIPGCDAETEFTCSPSGRCIEKGQFCDGVNDCEDDEPVGCSTLAPGPKVIIWSSSTDPLATTTTKSPPPPPLQIFFLLLLLYKCPLSPHPLHSPRKEEEEETIYCSTRFLLNLLVITRFIFSLSLSSQLFSRQSNCLISHK